jgi:hypothetical protein
MQIRESGPPCDIGVMLGRFEPPARVEMSRVEAAMAGR